MLYAAIAALVANRRKQKAKKKQIKRFWRREIFKNREIYSEYFTLYQELRNKDREFHYRYLRMSKERFTSPLVCLNKTCAGVFASMLDLVQMVDLVACCWFDW